MGRPATPTSVRPVVDAASLAADGERAVDPPGRDAPARRRAVVAPAVAGVDPVADLGRGCAHLDPATGAGHPAAGAVRAVG